MPVMIYLCVHKLCLCISEGLPSLSSYVIITNLPDFILNIRVIYDWQFVEHTELSFCKMVRCTLKDISPKEYGCLMVRLLSRSCYYHLWNVCKHESHTLKEHEICRARILIGQRERKRLLWNYRLRSEDNIMSLKARPHYSCACSPGLCSSGDSSGFYLCS
jgi:hypothetical protein